MPRTILTAKEISRLYAASSDALNGELFEIHGYLNDDEYYKLRDFNLRVEKVFPVGENYLFQIATLEKAKKEMLLLSEIAAEFPRLIMYPMAFDGKSTYETNLILSEAGFGVCYNKDENITIVYKIQANGM